MSRNVCTNRSSSVLMSFENKPMGGVLQHEGVGLWKTAEQGVRFRRAENWRSRRDIGAIVPPNSRFALGAIADAACEALRSLCGRLRRGETPLHRGVAPPRLVCY